MLIVENSIDLIQQMQLYDQKNGKFINFILWPKQIECLKILHSEPKIIVLKKRQVGLSQLTGADSLAHCMILDKFLCLILSKTAPDAEEYMQRVSDMYDQLPPTIKASAPIERKTRFVLRFKNGSRLVSLPATRGAGYTANRVVIDEAAYITRQEGKIELKKVLERVSPTLDKSSGQLILISTANGGNLFKKMFFQAQNKQISFYPFFFSCFDDPTFSEEKRLNIVRDFGDDHANQEYPRNPTEAFLSSGRPRFNLKKLENRIKLKPKLVGLFNSNGKIEKNDKGNCNFFVEYKNLGQYIIVADVAEGLLKGDYSCAKIFDRESWQQVMEWHGHIEPAQFGSEITVIARHYNNAVIIVEANNHGIATLTQIINVEKYPKELIFQSNYAQVKADDDFKDPQKRFGWTTTSRTKPIIIDNLADMINKNDESLSLNENDFFEISTYVIDKNRATNADIGCHDDRVITLAIAYYLLQFYPPKQFKINNFCTKCKFIDEQEQNCKKTKRWIKKMQGCGLFQENNDWYIPDSQTKRNKKKYFNKKKNN